MGPLDELNLLLKLIKKYELPLSPILEYSINQKKEGYLELGMDDIDTSSSSMSESDANKDVLFETDYVDSISIPKYADLTSQNRYILQFCYGMLSNFQYSLTDRERSICEMLLVQNDFRKTSSKYLITAERVRQIFVKSIQKISEAYQNNMKELDELRDEINELKNRNFLMEKVLESTKKLIKDKDTERIQETENQLCDNAVIILNTPVSRLPLSARTHHILRLLEVETFKDIPLLTDDQLLNTRNCGRKTITELRDLLSKFSMDLGMQYDDVVSTMKQYTNEDISINVFRLPQKNKKKKWRQRDLESEEKLIFMPEFDDVELSSNEEKRMNKIRKNNIHSSNERKEKTKSLLMKRKDDKKASKEENQVVPVSNKDEEKTIQLTEEIINAARTPNGGFTKSQLAAIGIGWPPPTDWISTKVGSMISESQLERFNHIQYISNRSSKSLSNSKEKNKPNDITDKQEAQRIDAVLKALHHFVKPATPRDIARTVSRSSWGGIIVEDTIEAILKRLPEVEEVNGGMYILKNKTNE